MVNKKLDSGGLLMITKKEVEETFRKYGETTIKWEGNHITILVDRSKDRSSNIFDMFMDVWILRNSEITKQPEQYVWKIEGDFRA